LAQPFGTEKDPVCGLNWANVWVIVVSIQRDALAILPILLNSISDFQSGWDYLHQASQWVDVHDSIAAVLNCPVCWDKCFHYVFAQWVFVLIEC
jgi:hypothetical protein